jgi:uncharacterized protein YndB with AHSA1/START domain
MAIRNDPGTEASGQELVITRVFDAPPDLVFKAWTEPEHFVQWWGPRGFTTPVCDIDLRPGGNLRFCMRSPEGADIWCGGVFQEITPPSRLAFIDYFTDQQGNRVSPTQYGTSADFPEQALVSVSFEDEGGKTRMTLRHSIAATLPEFEGAQEGWSQSLDRLADYLVTA